MIKAFGMAAACALAFAAAPASAEFQLDQTLVENFDGPEVGQVLDQLDAKWTRETTEDGTPFYNVDFANGYVGYAAPAACLSDDEKSQCMGLLVFASFDKPEDVSIATLKDRVNTYNVDYSPTKGMIEEDGTATIVLYIMTDYGIAKSNLYVQLEVFQDMMETFNSALLGETPPAE